MKAAFRFTALNSIKPDMITEATKGARAAAERFATDSGSKVGAIRQANQASSPSSPQIPAAIPANRKETAPTE